MARALRTLAVVALAAVAAGGLAAESAAQVVLDGSLGPQGALQGPHYRVGAELGQLRGANLFHSFAELNAAQGESLTFTGPASVRNVLGRVTGPNPSLLDGVLRSEIAGANLFLLNPRGIVVGPSASLEVSGAVHLSTADRLRLADGGVFHASLGGESVLTVAAPAAFGFLSASPAGVSVQGATLAVPAGKTLSVVAGEVRIVGATLSAPSGRVQIASAASAGEFGLRAGDGAIEASASGPAVLGAIHLEDGSLTTRGNPGGTVQIRGGDFTVDRSAISASGTGAIDHPGLGIDIAISGTLAVLGASEIAASSSGAGRAGRMQISAASLEVIGDLERGFFSAIASRAFSSGAAGSIDIVADSVLVKDGAFINTPSLAAGTGGDLRVTAGTIELLGQQASAFISTGGFGTGNSGSLTVNAERVLARGGRGFAGFSSQVSDQGSGGALGGRLDLTTASLTLLDGAQISSGIFRGSGRGGDLTVDADHIAIRGADAFGFRAGIFSSAEGEGATGTGGAVRVSAREIVLEDGGAISTNLFNGSPGTAGNVAVSAERLEVRNRAFIGAGATFGTGAGGSVDIAASSIVIEGVRATEDPFVRDFTGFSTATTVGAGGPLRVTASDLRISDRGMIIAFSLGKGAAGDITLDLNPGRLLLVDGGTVVSSAFGSGPGGRITIRAGEVTAQGSAPFNSSSDPGISGIASQAGPAGGSAGDIALAVGTLRLLDGSKLSTETFGPGRGGTITVAAEHVLVSGFSATLREAATPTGDPTAPSSAISASSSRGFAGDRATGDAGSVRITAGLVEVRAEGVITSKTDTPGAGGDIEILADNVRLLDRGLVSAQSEKSATAGRGGSVTIQARDSLLIDASAVTTAADQAEAGAITLSAHRIDLLNGALVSSTSSGPGDAGRVAIAAADAFRSRGSAVTTDAASADGGNITLAVGSLVHLFESEITAAVRTGVGKGGNVTIDPQAVALERSRISADAFGGPGGNVRIVADVFLTLDSVVSASSALGLPGTVDVQASITDVSGSLARLPEAGLQAAALLRAPCAVRLAEGRASSLVVRGRDGIPPVPGELLPGFFLAGEPPGEASRGAGVFELAGGWEPGFARLDLGPACLD